ncbi:MAG: SDR family oxidoreductase [bacterium]|nr:SDR family oxidoreductase [bacterium]
MKKIAVITGGTRGIGRALIEVMYLDYKIATCARDVEALEKLKLEFPEVFIEVCDVSELNQVSRFIRHTIEYLGVPYILINNAGILGEMSEVVSYDEILWRKVIDVNLNGVFYVTKGFLKYMLEKNEGIIVNITTGVARNIRPKWGAYAISKYAIEGFTKLLAEELKNTSIKVYAINPGRTRTYMRKKAYPFEDPMTLPEPKVVARKIVESISNANELHGSSIDVVLNC